VSWIRPSNEALAEPYWRGLAAGKLLIQRCADCGDYRHPPSPICARCYSFDHSWFEVSGRGSVFTFTIIHHPVHPLLSSWVPYNIALVELSEGPRIVSSIRGLSADEITVGIPLICEVSQVAPGFCLPYFR
jgi:uncharacterized protein